MASYTPTSSLVFSTQVMAVRNNRKIGAMQPDADGYYNGYPCMVVGIPSRNKFIYDTASVVNQITSPDSHFHVQLVEGGLYGEADHPRFYEYDDTTTFGKKAAISRMVDIDTKHISHHIRGMEVGQKLESGGQVINMSFTPTPDDNGKKLKMAMESKYQNPFFSLRGMSDQKVDMITGLTTRYLKRLVTFDYVIYAGFVEACKRYASIATEALSSLDDDILLPDLDLSKVITFSKDDQKAIISELATENLKDTELNELFKSNNITIATHSFSLVNPNDSVMMNTDTGKLHSLYQLMMGGKI